MNYYDLTNPQKSIWLMEEYYKDTNINNICGSLTIKEDVNLDILNKAINIFLQNNKSFGLNFEIKNGKAMQFFTEIEEQNFDKISLKDYTAVQEFAKETSEYIFNIHDKSLYKFILYKLENGYGGFIVLTHHIISDAATFGLIGTEISENYRKLVKHEEIEKKEYSYEDYIQSEKEYMTSQRFTKDEEYWTTLYKDIPEVASIPSISSKKNINLTGKAKRKSYLIGKTLSNKISNFCKANKVSNFNFFMAIYGIYLSRVSGLRDFVIRNSYFK